MPRRRIRDGHFRQDSPRGSTVPPNPTPVEPAQPDSINPPTNHTTSAPPDLMAGGSETETTYDLPLELDTPTPDSVDDVTDLVGELVPERADPTTRERARLSSARRDATGFITDAVPHITREQLRWLTHRLESGDDRSACALAEVDPYDVLVWMADPGFAATYQSAIENKREGFKVLTSHLLPGVIRALDEMLAHGSAKDKKEASTLILRAQGLFVDKTQNIDPSAIQSLFTLLREERPIDARILDVRSTPALE